MTFFHHDDPPFMRDASWLAKDKTSPSVKILSVKLWPRCSTGRHWYWDVDYLSTEGKLFSTDIWNFQSRYEPA